jgi:hypothetical protein
MLVRRRDGLLAGGAGRHQATARSLVEGVSLTVPAQGKRRRGPMAANP